MTRFAEPHELPGLFDLVAPIWQETNQPFRPYPGAWIESWRGLLGSGAGILLVAEQSGEIVGALGAVFFPNPNTGLLVAAENLWYVKPEARGSRVGLELYREFERETKRRQASLMVMGALAGSQSEAQLRKFYEREGYVALETTFAKTP